MSLPLGLSSFSPHCPGSSLRPCTDPCVQSCLDSCNVLDGTVCLQQPGPLSPSPAIAVSCFLFPGHLWANQSYHLDRGQPLPWYCSDRGLLCHCFRRRGPSAVKTHPVTSEVQPVFCPLSSPSLPLHHSTQNCFFSHPPLTLPLSARLSLPSPLGHVQETDPGRAAGPEPAGPGGPDGLSAEGPAREGGFV